MTSNTITIAAHTAIRAGVQVEAAPGTVARKEPRSRGSQGWESSDLLLATEMHWSEPAWRFRAGYSKQSLHRTRAMRRFPLVSGTSNVMRVTRKAAPRDSDPRIQHAPLCRVDALVLRDHDPRLNHDHATVRSRPRVLKRHMLSGSTSRRGPVPTKRRAELAMPLASDSDPASRRPLAHREQEATGKAVRKWRVAPCVRQMRRWTRSTSVRLHLATPDPSPSVSPMDACCPQAVTSGESRPARHPAVPPGTTEKSQPALHKPSPTELQMIHGRYF